MLWSPGSLPTLHPGVPYTQRSLSCTLRCSDAQGAHAAAIEIYSPHDSLCYSLGCWDPHTASLACYGSHAAPWGAAPTAAPLRVPSPHHGSPAALQSPGSPHAPLGITAHHVLLKVPLCTSAQCSLCCLPEYSVPLCPPGCDSPLQCSLGPPVPVTSSPLPSPLIPAGGEPPEEDEEEEVPELGDSEDEDVWRGRTQGELAIPPLSPMSPQVTLLSFAVEAEHTFLDYIRGG